MAVLDCVGLWHFMFALALSCCHVAAFPVAIHAALSLQQVPGRLFSKEVCCQLVWFCENISRRAAKLCDIMCVLDVLNLECGSARQTVVLCQEEAVYSTYAGCLLLRCHSVAWLCHALSLAMDCNLGGHYRQSFRARDLPRADGTVWCCGENSMVIPPEDPLQVTPLCNASAAIQVCTSAFCCRPVTLLNVDMTVTVESADIVQPDLTAAAKPR